MLNIGLGIFDQHKVSMRETMPLGKVPGVPVLNREPRANSHPGCLSRLFRLSLSNGLVGLQHKPDKSGNQVLKCSASQVLEGECLKVKREAGAVLRPIPALPPQR